MPTFTYFDNIPAGPNNPSVDQPNMQTNTNSTDGIINVDHYSFEQSNLDGWHKQVTLPANNVPGAQTGLASTVYSDVGISVPTKSQLYFRNSATIYPLSLCKAYALFSINGNGPSVTPINTYNCSVALLGTRRATITISANVFSNDDVGVLMSNNNARGMASYTFVNPTLTFTSDLCDTGLGKPVVTWTVLFLQI